MIYLHKILSVLMIIMMPLFFLGIINRTKSVCAGRQGPSVFQPFWDFFRLLKKGQVISETTTVIFKIAPSIIFASTITASLFVPFFNNKAILSFNGDFIIFIYMLALGRFFALISALDTGSSFEGMGASREALFSSLLEPAFFIIFGSLAAFTGYSSFSAIFGLLNNWTGALLLAKILCIISLLIIMLSEGCRVPVDDPNTHLELTMIHEVMVLDNSGPDLGFIIYSAALKMVIFAAMIANLIIPPNSLFITKSVMLIALVLLSSVFIGFIESLTARLRMNHVPQFLLFASSISLIVLSVIFLYNYGGMN